MTLGWSEFREALRIGISDDQLARELTAERRLKAAIAEMRRAIEEVNKSSALVEIEPSAFEDFVHDECPSDDYWAEMLYAARA
jgi:hypothetical protein